MKKGQAAMEFLMTYGWAILVILIMMGALIYFGVLNPENFRQNKCACAYINLEGGNKVNADNITYYECLNVTSYLDYENKKIIFNSTSKLFYCDHKELVEVT